MNAVCGGIKKKRPWEGRKTLKGRKQSRKGGTVRFTFKGWLHRLQRKAMKRISIRSRRVEA